jgi:hypothetical protein
VAKHPLLWHRLLDNFFALADATARAACRALSFGPPPGKPRRSRARNPEVQPTVEQLETRFLLTVLSFSASTYSVNENAGTVTVTVTEDTAPSATVGVSYATSGADAGVDYTSTSGSLSFAPTDPLSKSFTVPILNEGIADGNETFSVNLSNVTGPATLGSPSTATVTITETNLSGVTEYSVPTSSAGLSALTLGSDSNIWFTEYNQSKIAKVTPSGTITEYCSPYEIVAGSGEEMTAGIRSPGIGKCRARQAHDSQNGGGRLA